MDRSERKSMPLAVLAGLVPAMAALAAARSNAEFIRIY
jgi:hypothetical protein